MVTDNNVMTRDNRTELERAISHIIDNKDKATVQAKWWADGRREYKITFWEDITKDNTEGSD